MAVHKKHKIMKIESVGFMILDEDASKTLINTDTPKQVLKQETQAVKGKEEVCENCEKSFLKKKHLKSHMKTHCNKRWN